MNYVIFASLVFADLLDACAAATTSTVFILQDLVPTPAEETQITDLGYYNSTITLSIPEVIVLPDGTTVVTVRYETKPTVFVFVEQEEEPPVDSVE